MWKKIYRSSGMKDKREKELACSFRWPVSGMTKGVLLPHAKGEASWNVEKRIRRVTSDWNYCDPLAANELALSQREAAYPNKNRRE